MSVVCRQVVFKPSWTHETKPTHKTHGCAQSFVVVVVVVANFVKKKIPHILQ